MKRLIAICLTAVFTGVLGCGGGGGENDVGVADAGLEDAAGDASSGDTVVAECLYVPEASASEQTKRAVGGPGVIPNGRSITPEGDQLALDYAFSGNMVATPDGKTLIVTNNGQGAKALAIVDVATRKVRQNVPAPNRWFFYGLAVDPAGKRFYASGGGEQKIYVYDLDGSGMASLSGEISTPGGFPAGLALSKDGKKLYAAHFNKAYVAAYDTGTFDALGSVKAGDYPLAPVLSGDESKLYVSDWSPKTIGDPSRVIVLDAVTFAIKGYIVVGKNPEQIVPDHKRGRLYVMNSDQDTISVIDESKDEVTATVSLLSSPDAPNGVTPVSGVLSPDGATLFVAAAGKNSIEVLDAEKLTVRGSIPVAWYPTAVQVSGDGTEIYALNAKGEGSGANGKGKEEPGELLKGSVSFISTPGSVKLEDLTRKVTANNTRPLSFFPKEQCAGMGFPVPFLAGGDTPIEHVIFILKENRTFDQVMGDFEGADGDPELVTFGEEITPNLHELARRYVLLDNYYCESDKSVQGHLWSTAMASNDFTERTWAFPDDFFMALPGIEPATGPLNPYIFEHLYNQKISFIDYGEIVGMGAQNEKITKYWDQSYPGIFYSTDVKDVVKADYVVGRINKGFLPKFTYMLLPCDHTNGTSPGAPTPESMVADNDEAVGRLIDGLSKSKFWKNTVVFITEDDPQDGYDHVDAHRTYSLVISPWTKKGYVSKTHYAIGSFFATAERVLDFPPLNDFDTAAAPLFDCFTNKPDLSTYDYIPRKVPENVNTILSPFAAESSRLDFSVPDNAPGLQKILWHYMKGTKPYPGADDDD